MIIAKEKVIRHIKAGRALQSFLNLMDTLDDYAKLQAELETANEENKRLKEFARVVIRQECWSIFEQDGGDIQELAEKLGLIVPCVATEEDINDDCDCGVGDAIFKFSQALKGD